MGVIDATDPFSRSYEEARAKFLRACGGLPVHSYADSLRGIDAERLAVDLVCMGDADAQDVLLISSGCHGVEGFCGSGVQVDLLRNRDFRSLAQAAGVAVILVHALNPWGFSFGRRVTSEGVDLNRNFVDFSRSLPSNPGYDALAAPLVPTDWPPGACDEHALSRFIAERGMGEFQRAVSSGQYGHPAGLFYGGAAPTWSHLTLRRLLRQHGSRCRRLAWIDLHSGLGEPGVGERIFAGRDLPEARARARAWWGDEVTFLDDGSSSSAALEGSLWQAAHAECPQAAFTAIALEFGTRPVLDVLRALRFDHWAARNPHAPESLRIAARASMRDAFFVDTAPWRRAVLDQAHEAASLAIVGLADGR